jgi:hypothetical protein
MRRRPQLARTDGALPHGKRENGRALTLDADSPPMLRAGGQVVLSPDRLPSGERGVRGSAPVGLS